MHASQDAHKHILTLLPILPWQKQAKEFCYSLESSEKVSHTVRRRAHMPESFQYLYLINHMSGVTLLFNITVLHWSPTQRWVWSIQVSLSLSKSPVFHRSIQSSILTEHPPDTVNLDSEGAHKTQCVHRTVISLFIDYKVHLIWGYSVSQHFWIHSPINKALLALYHEIIVINII